MSRSSLLLLVLSLVASSLMGCAQRDGFEESVVARRTARGASALLQSTISSGIPLEPLSTKVWGEILGDASGAFQAEAVGLMQATVSPNEVGLISPFSGDVTGIRFWGSVDLQSGPLTSASVSATSIALNTARLQISIWDSFAGTEDSNGNIIPEYSISMDQVLSNSSVSGNTANIVFQDAYGQITLSGTFDQNFFQGTISYQNLTSFNAGIAPRSGVLGSFVVQTCGFFSCQ